MVDVSQDRLDRDWGVAMIAFGIRLREQDHSVNAKLLILFDNLSIESTYRSDSELKLAEFRQSFMRRSEINERLDALTSQVNIDVEPIPAVAASDSASQRAKTAAADHDRRPGALDRSRMSVDSGKRDVSSVERRTVH